MVRTLIWDLGIDRKFPSTAVDSLCGCKQGDRIVVKVTILKYYDVLSS